MRKLLSIFLMLAFILSVTPVESQGYKSMSKTVTTMGGARLITVYYFAGSEDWAKYILKSVEMGFPLLEQNIGVECPEDWDIKIYELKSAEEGVGGINKGRDGLYVLKETSAAFIIHELAHYWQRKNQSAWIREGFPEAYTILTLRQLGMEEGDSHWLARVKQFEWALNQIGDKPLDRIGYHTDFTDPSVALLYSKAMVFYTRLIDYVGLEKMKEFNREIIPMEDLYTKEFKNKLEEFQNEDLDWLFSGWVYKGKYQDPWWFEWREELPKQLDSLSKDANEFDDKISEHDLYIDYIFDKFDGLDTEIMLGNLDYVKSKISEIEEDLKRAKEGFQEYLKIKNLIKENNEILDKYGIHINTEERLGKIENYYNNGQFEKFYEELEFLSRGIQDLADAVKKFESSKKMFESEKPYFKGLGLEIDVIEKDIEEMENALMGENLDIVKNLSEDLREKMSKAKEAALEYEIAKNTKKKLFKKDPSPFLEKARKEFDAGNYQESIEYSKMAVEISKETNIVFVLVLIVFSAFLLGGVSLWLKKIRVKPTVVLSSEKVKEIREKFNVGEETAKKIFLIKAKIEGMSKEKKEKIITDELLSHFKGLTEAKYYLQKRYGSFEDSEVKHYLIKFYKDVSGEELK